MKVVNRDQFVGNVREGVGPCFGLLGFDSFSRPDRIERLSPVLRRVVVRRISVPKWRNWQTRMVQVHVLARVWGFESLLRHHVLMFSCIYNTSCL